MLMQLPNVSRVSTCVSGFITVVGDLHGKLDDLYVILQKVSRPMTLQGGGDSGRSNFGPI